MGTGDGLWLTLALALGEKAKLEAPPGAEVATKGCDDGVLHPAERQAGGIDGEEHLHVLDPSLEEALDDRDGWTEHRNRARA